MAIPLLTAHLTDLEAVNDMLLSIGEAPAHCRGLPGDAAEERRDWLFGEYAHDALPS